MLEQGLLESLRPSETGAFMAIDGMRAEAIVSEAGRLVEAAEQQGITPVLACSPQLRLPLMRLLKAGSRRVQVLSYTEISGSTAQIETMGVVNGAYAGAA
jgi:flagellar biosynthesis protein FlhA